MKIDREDMLELTRRMTVSRNCFSRIAGAYMDEEGYIDGTFHTNFLKLSASDRARNPFFGDKCTADGSSAGSGSKEAGRLLAVINGAARM